MKIIGWTWYGNPEYKEMFPIGLEVNPNCDWDREEVKQVIAEELRRCGYRITGDYHQNGDYGVPIFDNNMVATFTFGEWGGIMYKAYPEEDYPKGMEATKWAWNWSDYGKKELIVPVLGKICNLSNSPENPKAKTN